MSARKAPFLATIAMTGKRPKPPAPKIPHWNIHKGDLVEIIHGKDKGKQGKVLEVIQSKNRVVVEGARVVKRFVAPDKATNQPGGFRDQNQLVHYSEVALVDPETKKPTRAVKRKNENGKTIRLSSTTGSLMPLEKYWIKERPDVVAGPKDTKAKQALKTTYQPSMLSFQQTILLSVQARRQQADALVHAASQ